MVTRLGRRDVLALGIGAMLNPRIGAASGVIDLDWPDLLPEGADVIPPALRAFIDHDGPALIDQQTQSSGVRSDWNGKTVRLRGFVVPLDQVGTAVTAFILVPFAGSCIHVPPPPPNQLVFVTTQEPYESKGLFAPVYVTGQFAVSSLSTHLAQVGYAMAAEKIEPYTA